jgi:hypothetical protein
MTDLRTLPQRQFIQLMLAHAFYLYFNRELVKAWFHTADSPDLQINKDLQEMGLLKSRCFDGHTIYRISKKAIRAIEGL